MYLNLLNLQIIVYISCYELIIFQSSNDGETIKKEKDKPPGSPYDSVNSSKKEMENGNCSTVVQQNGMVVVQNGLDEDKYIKLVLLVHFNQLEAHNFPSILC